MQTGPQMSPRDVPRVLQAAARSCCGAGPRSWPTSRSCSTAAAACASCCRDLIDAGLDAINPVQITCRGMDAGGLKADFGKDLTFWGGGCDTRDVLLPRHARGGRRARRGRSRSSGPAAASSSSRSTTSWPTSRRRTSSPCSTRSTADDAPSRKSHSDRWRLLCRCAPRNDIDSPTRRANPLPNDGRAAARREPSKTLTVRAYLGYSHTVRFA